MTIELARLVVRLPGGFVTSGQVAELRAMDRLLSVLVRCGRCRFTCAVQDLEFLITCIEAGGDYVRDVSVTAREIEEARRMLFGAGAMSDAPTFEGWRGRS